MALGSERKSDSAGSKRKSAMPMAPSHDAEAPSSKRRKVTGTNREGTDKAIEAGNALLDRLRNARDKKNWPIATHFMTLPDRETLPDYYEQITLPIAFDTIQSKLEARQYESVSALESDFKRMIFNAKSYNEKTSQVFGDAEKIRKIVSVFMENHNPAYQTPGYHPVPTPLPGETPIVSTKELKKEEGAPEATDDTTHDLQAGRRSGRNIVESSPRPQHSSNRVVSSPPIEQRVEGAGESFKGDTFQKAQEKIITELIELTDDDGNSITANFLNLPSRALLDYYRVIKRPVSISRVRKLVLGIKGRDAPTGKTLLKSWDAFETEVSYIWRNAREYNEDGSAIVGLAETLESYFKARLSEAKSVVLEPPQPLKLTMKSQEAPKITLKFGSQRHNGATGVSVDHSALQRQQRDVQNATNGQTPNGASQVIATGSGISATKESVEDTSVHSNGEQGTPAQLNGVKRESSHVTSPAPPLAVVNGLGIGGSAGVPPPVAQSSRMPSGSPHPTAAHGSTQVASSHSLVNTATKSNLRPSGKDASDALIMSLNVETHPDLDSAQKLHFSIPASSTKTEQSVTIKLSRRQWRLLITPTLSASLLQRPSRTFVTCNGRRVHTLPQPEVDQRRPVYEHKVTPGTNTIEVEVIAGMPRGAPKIGSGQEIELEKFTVFAYYQQ